MFCFPLLFQTLYLIEQRLKQVMIASVYEGYPD